MKKETHESEFKREQWLAYYVVCHSHQEMQIKEWLITSSSLFLSLYISAVCSVPFSLYKMEQTFSSFNLFFSPQPIHVSTVITVSTLNAQKPSSFVSLASLLRLEELGIIRKLQSVKHSSLLRTAGEHPSSCRLTCKSRCRSSQMKQHRCCPLEPSIRNLQQCLLSSSFCSHIIPELNGTSFPTLLLNSPGGHI